MDYLPLKARERWFLFRLRFKKKIKPRFDVSNLVAYGLIRRNSTGKRNEIGCFIMADTYSKTDYADRYRIAVRHERFKRIITPIGVSVVTSIVTTYALRLLFG